MGLGPTLRRQRAEAVARLEEIDRLIADEERAERELRDLADPAGRQAREEAHSTAA